MVARSVVTLGVSTERGAVHAVALADAGEKLPERVLLHRVEKTHGDSKADLAAAVETAMDELAAEIGPDREIGGAAVAYRDAAERRAIVTRLANGPWHTASLVSAKAAHLQVAAMMTWLGEFDDLLVCEVVPGHQSFTLVDRDRRRVLAAIGQAGGATAESMGAAVTAAWDQFEAAAVRPDAVVLIGSAAREPAVLTAVDSFGAPIIPCKIATSATAVGAALSALAELGEQCEPLVSVRRARGVAALFAAASVLAGGLVAGGLYVANGSSRTVVADARVTADAKTVGGETGSAGSGEKATDPKRPIRLPSGQPPVAPAPAPVSAPVRAVASSEAPPGPQRMMQRWGSLAPEDRPLPLIQSEPARESEQAATSKTSGSGAPAGTTKVGAPNGALLFPGELPPPPAFTPESYHWWDNHVRLMLQWAAQQLLPV